MKSSDVPDPAAAEALLVGSGGARRTGSAGASGIEAFAAALGVDAAAADRARQRWLVQQAAESSTVAGVLADLGEAGDPVMVGFHGGRRASVRVVAVGLDVVAFEHRDGHRSIMRIDSVSAIRPAVGHEVAGDRPSASDFAFVDAVAFIAADRPDVALFDRRGDASLAGRLLTAGADIIKLRLESNRNDLMHVPLDAIGGLAVR